MLVNPLIIDMSCNPQMTNPRRENLAEYWLDGPKYWCVSLTVSKIIYGDIYANEHLKRTLSSIINWIFTIIFVYEEVESESTVEMHLVVNPKVTTVVVGNIKLHLTHDGGTPVWPSRNINVAHCSLNWERFAQANRNCLSISNRIFEDRDYVFFKTMLFTIDILINSNLEP